MKLTSALALTAVVFGVAACATGSTDEQGENTGSTQQAMCLNYPDCITSTSTRTWDRYNTGGLNTLDTTSSSSSGGTSTTTFSCNGKASLCLDPDNHYLACNPSNPNECVCMTGCGGGGWPYGTYNPCPYGKTYSCTSYGYCTCW